MCLEDLRRFRGSPDSKGWVYGSYGDTAIAADTNAAYRHYNEDDSWVVFANIGGLLPLTQRTLIANAPATASRVSEIHASVTLPENPVEAVSPVIANSAVEAESATQQQLTNGSAAGPQASPSAATQTTVDSPIVAAVSASSVMPVSADPASSVGDISTLSLPAVEDLAKQANASSTKAINIEQTHDRCQYRRDDTWLTSEDFDLASCIARVKAEQESAASSRGVTNGYWNGVFIYVTTGDVYTTEDPAGPWSKYSINASH